MCGIAGIASFSEPEDQIVQCVNKMTDAIAHRGPDSHGVWFTENRRLVLGHRRLSIQDLSELGAQPMRSHSGRFVIVFNGEIYNFKDIAQQLERKGVSFLGHSDTEVLLSAVENWGVEAALKKIKGMFALALYDRKEEQLFLARDRLGEKPLYYGLINDQFVFASELKAIYAVHQPSTLKIDKSALSSYLRYGYLSSPFSIFQEIKKLPAGQYLRLDLKTAKLGEPEDFWSLSETKGNAQNQLRLHEQSAISELDALLNKVVCEQAIADVPLGAFLSGGIDSSVVSAVLQANSSAPIDTFTIGFHEKQFNEAIHAKSVAQHLGTNHHELYLGPEDALEIVPSLVKMYDEPFADSSQIPMFLVSQLAKNNVTVCLSGDGGDELFGGYNRYVMTDVLYRKIGLVPPPLRPIISKVLLSVSPNKWDQAYGAIMSILRRKGSASLGLKIHKLAEVLNHKNKEESYKFLSSYWHDPTALLVSDVDEPSLNVETDFEVDFLESAMLWDQKWYLPGDNLVKSDRASMAVSLEMRLPLMDQELVDFSWSIPDSMKIKNGISKWILRQVLYRYVPQNLIDRPKMGFSVPVAQWIRKELKDWSSDLLCPEFLDRQGLFSKEVIGKCYREHMEGVKDHSHKLWTILMFQAWYKEYIGK